MQKSLIYLCNLYTTLILVDTRHYTDTNKLKQIPVIVIIIQTIKINTNAGHFILIYS